MCDLIVGYVADLFAGPVSVLQVGDIVAVLRFRSKIFKVKMLSADFTSPVSREYSAVFT